MNVTWKRIVLLMAVFLFGLIGCSNDQEIKSSSNKPVHQEVPTENLNDEQPTKEASMEEDQMQTDDQKPTENSSNQEDEIENKEGAMILKQLQDPSVAILVNKEYGLTEDDVPPDLKTVEVPTVLENPEVKQLRKEAANALYDMFAEAKKDGIFLHARSGYRSYETQVHLFNSYAEKHGEEAANRYSAKPGHSEHQTGLVMDVTSESVQYQLVEEFGETEEGLWVKENAHHFGFIIRYPEGKEEITGYIYEPWHLRYLGIDLATAVYESGLTYEEYLDREGIIHEVNAEKVTKDL